MEWSVLKTTAGAPLIFQYTNVLAKHAGTCFSYDALKSLNQVKFMVLVAFIIYDASFFF